MTTGRVKLILVGMWVLVCAGGYLYARSDAAFGRFAGMGGGLGEQDPVDIHQRLSALHEGGGPCLRYAYLDPQKPGETEVRPTAVRLAALRIDGQTLADLIGQFMLWTEERESAAHRDAEVEEVSDALSAGRAFTRFVLWVQRDKIAQMIRAEAGEHHAHGRETFSKLDPAQQRGLRALWEQNPRHFVVDALVPLLDVLRRDVTHHRLDALAAAVQARFDRGETDEVRLQSLAEEAGVPSEDGVGVRFGLEDEGGVVTLRSYGIEELSREVARPAPAAAGGTEVGAADCSGAPVAVRLGQADLHAALDDLDALAQGARIVPAFFGGQVIGFKVFGIRHGSLFTRLGLCDGDIIQRANGIALRSPDEALRAYQHVRDAERVQLDLLRAGTPHALDVHIQ